MLDDLRIGFRLLLKNRAFSLTAALTLAICIGANTALFSVVHAVLLNPLPVPEPERVMLMGNAYPNAGAGGGENSSIPHYYDRLKEVDVFEEQSLYDTRTQSVDLGGTPTRITVGRVTPSFFRMARVPAGVGRTFTEAEGEPGNEFEAVLSYSLWRSQYAGDPGVAGKEIRIDGKPYTVVGVMPKSFVFADPDVLLWTPAAFTAEERSDDNRHSNGWYNIARLKPGATMEQAQAQVDALNARNLDRFPQYKELLINAGFHTIVRPFAAFLVRDIRPVLYLLWGGALFVLLIGAVNVANLTLARARARVREMATRHALGAGRLRLARQLVIESVSLTSVAAAAGLFLGAVALKGLELLAIQDLRIAQPPTIDAMTVAFTLAVSLVVGVALGLLPMAGAVPTELGTALREDSRGGTAGRGARALRRSLVVTQVAFAYVLLVGAGLLFASFRQILAIDPGFRPEGVMTASVALPRTRYADEEALRKFSDEAMRQIRALPGVSAAGVTDTIPFGGHHSDSVILAEGYQMQKGESLISPTQATASPGYFESVGATLKAGRFFEEGDGAKGKEAVIVDEKLARRFWKDQDPIGRRMFLPTDINNLMTVTKDTVFLTVVGVVRDIKLGSLTEGHESVGTYFFPETQSPSRMVTFVAKTTGDPTALAGSLRGVLTRLDRELPVFDALTLQERTARALMGRRAPVLLSLGFAGVALFLSAIGLYGVLAYLVTQRTKEIAIRMALGSTAAGVFNLILREGVLLIGGGFLLGAAGAYAVRRGIESQLFGVAAGDPVVLLAVALALGVVAFAACALPARRAARIDPTLALAE
ncbi:MAG TPA: ABC transporter permease [Candidatus Polarisedimenticolia bacterium]|nr:ABC transporter permease [Candidatus Polarisedimenticolia bacterium]